MVAKVIALDERRQARPTPTNPLTELTQALDELLKALELLRRAPRSTETDEAHHAVLAAGQLLLAREKRMQAWAR